MVSAELEDLRHLPIESVEYDLGRLVVGHLHIDAQHATQLSDDALDQPLPPRVRHLQVSRGGGDSAVHRGLYTEQLVSQREAAVRVHSQSPEEDDDGECGGPRSLRERTDRRENVRASADHADAKHEPSVYLGKCEQSHEHCSCRQCRHEPLVLGKQWRRIGMKSEW